MTVVVRVPASLRPLTGGAAEVSVEAATVGEVLDKLDITYPGLKSRLCEADGSLRGFVGLYLRGEDVRFRQGLATELADGDRISIIPTVAGG